jgi:hypothetical protein
MRHRAISLAAEGRAICIRAETIFRTRLNLFAAREFYLRQCMTRWNRSGEKLSGFLKIFARRAGFMAVFTRATGDKRKGE